MGAIGTLSVYAVVLTGLKMDRAVEYVEPSNPADGDVFANSGRTFIHVIAGASTIEVTVDSVAKCNQDPGYDHDAVVSLILTGQERMIGPFPKDRFNDAEGNVNVKCDPHTGVEIAAIEVP